MILVIDNYDSFTYNLVHLIGRETPDIEVYRNDALRVEEALALQPAGIVISPGPGRPDQAGITMDLIRAAGDRIPVLGVCLGHQAIGQVFGGDVVHAPSLMHGKTSFIEHNGRGLFAGLTEPFEATRYHSLVVAPATLPDSLEVTAETSDGIIMGLNHKTRPVFGIQFHPESVMTLAGPAMIRNWLGVVDAYSSHPTPAAS
ncbi:MAG: aminodeoxychorismate/anthranilate synthase component II [Rhodothermales bacterium]